MTEPFYDVHPPKARWTHIALRVKDMDATVDWYTEFTPLEVLERREDSQGYGAWLGMSDSADSPFLLVVAQFFEETDPFSFAPRAVLAPFAHLGIELTTKDDVDVMAERGREADCLSMEPTMLPAPIGYVCMLTDPDGNTVEFSWDQGVYAIAKERWGKG